MGTVLFSCDCSISSSMFGDRPYMFINNCLYHSQYAQSELKALADKLKELQQTHPKTNEIES